MSVSTIGPTAESLSAAVESYCGPLKPYSMHGTEFRTSRALAGCLGYRAGEARPPDGHRPGLCWRICGRLGPHLRGA